MDEAKLYVIVIRIRRISNVAEDVNLLGTATFQDSTKTGTHRTDESESSSTF